MTEQQATTVWQGDRHRSSWHFSFSSLTHGLQSDTLYKVLCIETSWFSLAVTLMLTCLGYLESKLDYQNSSRAIEVTIWWIIWLKTKKLAPAMLDHYKRTKSIYKTKWTDRSDLNRFTSLLESWDPLRCSFFGLRSKPGVQKQNK